MESKTYTNRTNARRAGVQAGIPTEQVEITVHKSKDEVRFGFKRGDAPAAPVASEKKAKAAAPVVSTVKREERNGVKRPSPGGACAAVWDWLAAHPGASVKEAKAALPDLNANNVSCEVYQWRKFNTVTVKA